jgi:hypothetical protein
MLLTLDIYEDFVDVARVAVATVVSFQPPGV